MDGEACRQPGCGGTIEAGFCNRCGLEPANATATVSAVTVGAGSGGTSGATGSSLSTRTGSTPSRRGSASIRSSTRRHLGLGIVAVPELPPLDPEKVVMAEPKVPEHKRFCPNPDCHDEAGNPTPLNRREAGWCPRCGTHYSFVPTLRPGDVVAEQYEVKGCLAFGGLGWIYLAKDTTLGRWVVLKGLLNAGDESAAAAAVAERQFLAAVKHPNIVGIYNFVKRGAEGFIVMEYVGGTTIKELRKSRGPLPPAEAIAYVHRILGAFAYLHRLGLVYCDMKPENFMLEGDPPDVKLIDMGGVRRIDDTGGDIYGTKGYSAPEAGEGPTVVTDLYTLGRTLAVLLMDFRFQSTYEFSLPPASEQPVLARHESLHRFLLRATATDADRRFQTADEMADQLGGVLREVVAVTGGAEPRPVESTFFGGDMMALHEGDGNGDGVEATSADLLPMLKVNPDDPGANFLLSTVAVASPKARVELLRGALSRFPESVEVPLQLAKALIAGRSFDQAEDALAQVERRDPFDWRVTWYRGQSRLARGEAREAQADFDRVYSELPGEPAAKLALAVAAEAAGDAATAIRLYDLVSRTDPSFVTAAFGLARCLAREGRRADAVEAYGRVPPSSSLYTRAQMALARALIRTTPAVPGADELQKASTAVEALALEGLELVRLKAEVLENALALVADRAVAADPSIRLLGRPLASDSLRLGLEEAFRQMARLETDRARQIALVDRANQVRPRTWL
ncbi:MAG: protein kinase [Singulisphaera sp.]|nr:protein kinase [Singulisphaera sp.]